MQDRIPNGPVRDLLAAVLDALDIPHPATVGDSEAHDRILIDRASHAKIALRGSTVGTVGTREEIARAVIEGTEAGRRDDPATVCPYRGILRTAWIKGYARTAPPINQTSDA
ncbi:Rmf/CrpP fold protein [Streptomyces sp. NPDC002758]